MYRKGKVIGILICMLIIASDFIGIFGTIKIAKADFGDVVDSFDSPGDSPCGLTWDGTYLWNCDNWADRIYKLTTSGNIVDSFSTPEGGAHGLAWDGTYLWNSDVTTNKIYKLTITGDVLDSFNSPGIYPTGLDFDGTNLWLIDTHQTSGYRVYKITITGDVIDSFDSPGNTPRGIAWDGTNLWVSDIDQHKIYRITTSGDVVDSFDSPGPAPHGLAWDGTYLWNADFINKKIYKIDVSENQPPYTPDNPSPSDGATGVDLDPILSVDVSDPDGDNMDVTVYDASDDSIIGTDYDVADGNTASVTWSGLSYSTTYHWYTIVDDGDSQTRGPTSGSWSFTTISEPNDPPNTPTKPSGPQSIDNGDTATYTTRATDPNQDQVRYQFDWGDGNYDWTQWVNSGETASKTHSWDTPGEYHIRAKAQDEQGAESSWSEYLTVNVHGPLSVEANGPYKGYTTLWVQFQGSASGGTAPYNYNWDFGDGQTSNEQNPQHIYIASGTYTATLTVTDNDGTTKTDTATVNVKHFPIWVETLLIAANEDGSWDGEHFHAEVPFNSEDVQGLIDIIGDVPGDINFPDGDEFNGPYDFNINYDTLTITIDLYPYNPGSESITLSGGVGLHLETYDSFIGGSFDAGASGNFKKTGDDFEWDLKIYLNGDITFPVLRIQGMVFFVPVYAKVDLDLGAGIAFYLASPTEWNQQVFDHINGFFSIGTTFHEGIGVTDIIGLGLYQKIKGSWYFRTPEVDGSIFDSFTATFILGAYGELWGVGEGRWEWYRTHWSSDGLSYPVDDPIIENWHFMARNYGNPSWTGGADGVIMDEVFPGSHPYISRNSNGDKMMVWVQDDLNKGDHGDGLDLWCSIWDKNNEKWGTPHRITDDNRGQTNPSVALLNNGDAICVFNYLQPSSGKNLGQMLKTSEIGYTYWDGSSWSMPKLIVDGGTSDHYMDSYPIIKAAGNKAVVVWLCDDDAEDIENENGGGVFTVNDRVLYGVFWNGSSWSSARIISDKNVLSAPVGLAIKDNGEEAVCVYSVDEDGSLSSRNDQNIYMTTFYASGFLGNMKAIGDTIAITTGSGRNSCPSVNYVSGDVPSVTWVREEETSDDLSASILYETIDNSLPLAGPEVVEDGLKYVSSGSLFRSESLTLGGNPTSVPLVTWNDGSQVCYKRKLYGKWEDKKSLYSSDKVITQSTWDYDGIGGEVSVVFVEKDNLDSHDNCQFITKSSGKIAPPGKPDKPYGPKSGFINTEYEYNTVAIDDTGEILYQWDWGDGTTSDWFGPYPSGSVCKASHIWTSPGNYKVKVQAKNHLKKSPWSDSLSVDIHSHPPKKPTINGPTSGAPEKEYQYKIKASDPDGDTIYYYVDWGDGSNSGWVGPFKSGEETIVSHTWLNKGSYILKARTKDLYDEKSDWSQIEVTMGNRAPGKPSRPSGPSSGKVGKTYTYSTSTTDSDGDQVKYCFDWGDGTNSGWIGPYNSGEIASASHKWIRKGDYQIKVKAKDTDGAERPWSDSLSVSIPRNKVSIILIKFLDHFSVFSVLKRIIQYIFID